MILISHRGNLNGPSDLENHPIYVKEAIAKGFDCEVDVWLKDGEYWLGHDEPTYDVSRGFLQNDKLWCHAKNLEALEGMLAYGIHCFWHEEDDFTLTSKGYIWTYPDKGVCLNSVIVQLKKGEPPKNCHGLCTDFPSFY